MLTEATRGENVPKLWDDDRGAPRVPRRRGAARGAAARATSRARCSRSRRRARRRISSARCADDPELRRLLDEVQRRELDPLRRSARSWRRCSRLKTETAPTLADIEEARARLVGVARVTPVYVSETFSRLRGREVCAQGREPPAHRLLQDPRRRTTASSTLTRRRSARRASSPRARATTGRRSRGRRARSASKATDLHAAGRADGEGRGDANYGARDRARRRAVRGRARGRRVRAPRRAARRSCTRSRTTRVIAGQGTIGLELVEQVPDVGTVVVPIGGGGLAAGIALALRALGRTCGIVGRPGGRHAARRARLHDRGRDRGQAAGRADDGDPRRDRSTTSSTVTDEEISEAIVLLLERTKLVVEGAGAASAGGAARRPRRRVGTGRADPLRREHRRRRCSISVMRHGLTLAGRYLVVRTRVPDRPGELASC